MQGKLRQFSGLLVLDNAEVEADVRLLLPPPESPCKTIITARDQSLLRRITESEPVVLATFTLEQAYQCFRDRLGEEAFEAQAEAIAELCDLLDYLPLAADLAAATVFADQVPVSSWVRTYPDETGLLVALAPDDLDLSEADSDEIRRSRSVRAVLRLSLRPLPEMARRLVYALSCFDPGSGGNALMISRVAELDQDQENHTELELNRLYQRSVLQTPVDAQIGGLRYTMHRLMREVVRREAGDQLPDYEARFFNLFSALPKTLTGLVSEHRSAAAFGLFNTESANLILLALQMAGQDAPSEGVAETLPEQWAVFAAHIAQFAAMHWSSGFRRQLLEPAAAICKSQVWQELEATTLSALGELELGEDRLDQARARYLEALGLFREIADLLT